MTIRKQLDSKIQEYGLNLRRLRNIKGYTIERLAEISNISEKTISNIENGKNMISIATLIQIYEGGAFPEYTSLTDLFEALINYDSD